jgi:hypothetical protein
LAIEVVKLLVKLLMKLYQTGLKSSSHGDGEKKIRPGLW